MTTNPFPKAKYYWNFNEASGSTAKDGVSSAVIKLAGPLWVSGKYNKGIQIADNLNATMDPPLPDIAPPWTAACWVYRQDDAHSGSSALFSSDTYAIKLEQYDSPLKHQVGFTKYTRGNQIGFDKTIGSGYTTPVKQWFHVTVVATASDLTLYVQVPGNPTPTVLSMPTTEPIKLGLHYIGRNWVGGEYAEAIFDEIKIFETNLTADQVKELPQEGLPPDPVSPPTPTPPPSPSPIFSLGGRWRVSQLGGEWNAVVTVINSSSFSYYYIDDRAFRMGPDGQGAVLNATTISLVGATNISPGTLLAGPPDRIFFSLPNAPGQSCIWTRIS